MQLSINSKEVQAVTVLNLSGDLMSPAAYALLRDRVGELLARNRRKVLLHLNQIGQIDSGGLGNLVRVCVSSRKQGGEIKLANPSTTVRVALEFTGLIRMLEVYPTEQEALASFE